MKSLYAHEVGGGIKDHVNKDYFFLELTSNANLDTIIQNHPNWQYEHPSMALDHYHVFSVEKNSTDLHKREDLDDLNDLGVLDMHFLPSKRLQHRAPIPNDDFNYNIFNKRAMDSSQEKIMQVASEFGINDPIFGQQWHILNPNFPGNDVNVVPVWKMNITGHGVTAAIVDDGLDYESVDLKDNYCAEGSWDYNNNRPNPKPMLSSDYHGTRCAGEIAAGKGDEFCGVGVAYNSRISGIRILSGEITADEEAAAMIYGLNVNDIYSCSWGPPDNGRSMEQPEKVVKEAMLKGIQDGRDGKGALYVFASGNGAARGDSCNFDGYTNSIYSITVAAIDHKGLHPPYSEACTAVLVSTYSSGSNEYIHTTDINDKCSENHGGTSAAAPLAAGIYSLILEANPDLTWRDVQFLTVLSAVEIDETDESWQNTALEGRRYSPKYGWGKIDAEKMVQKAQDWQLVKPQGWYYSPYKIVDTSIKNEIGEVVDTFTIEKGMLEHVNFNSVEHITVTVHIESNIRGAVEVDLVSPRGIRSTLAVTRSKDKSNDGFRRWTFSSVAHWGEDGVGEWTIKVKNTVPENSIKFNAWQLKLFGDVIDPSKAKRFDINKDYSIIEEETPQESDNETSSTTLEQLPITDQITSSTIIELPATTENALTTEATSHTTTGDSNDKQQTDIVPIETTASSTPSSTSISPSSSSFTHKAISQDHYMWYFSGVIILGFALIMFVVIRGNRAIGRARRRDEFEFDIIHPSENEDNDDDGEDDDVDEFDIELNDFDFDDDVELRGLSENDHLMETSNAKVETTN